MSTRHNRRREFSLFGWLDRLATDKPVLLSFLIFLVVASIVVPVSVPFFLADPYPLIQNIVAESYGMLFDLLIIGWFITWMNRRAERRIMIRGYQEEIENMLRWESAEAMHRIASNIRRLNQEGISEIELEHAWLQGAYLVEANLCGARAREATFSGAKLERAELERADLTGAQFELTGLTDTRLQSAMMAGANLMGAYALRANLEATHLRGANLQGAFLVEANLRRADLGGANFRGAFLERTDLRGAFLDGANLEDARSLYGALLDPHVEEGLREIAPHLFAQSKLPVTAYPDGGAPSSKPAAALAKNQILGQAHA